MGKIDDIISSLGKQDTQIAVIKTINGNTEEHLKTLNGKVQAHESRLQTQEGNNALNATALANLLKRDEQDKSFWERNWEKLFWFALACIFTYFMSKK